MSWDLAFWKDRSVESPRQIWERLSEGQTVQSISPLSVSEVLAAFVLEYPEGDLRADVEESGFDLAGRGWEASLTDGDGYLYVSCVWGFAQDEVALASLVRAGLRAGLSAYDVQSGAFWPAPDSPGALERFDLWDWVTSSEEEEEVVPDLGDVVTVEVTAWPADLEQRVVSALASVGIHAELPPELTFTAHEGWFRVRLEFDEEVELTLSIRQIRDGVDGWVFIASDPQQMRLAGLEGANAAAWLMGAAIATSLGASLAHDDGHFEGTTLAELLTSMDQKLSWSSPESE